MKRIILILFVAILLLGGLGAAAFSIGNPLKPGNTMKTPDADLAFAVLGDIHGNTDSFQKAIKDLHKINPVLDALVLNGDTVDQGIEEQYQAVTKVLNKNIASLPKTIIKNIGNHEFLNYDQEGANNPTDVATFIGSYLRFAGENKVYHDTWINGYHFISLGSEDGNSETTNSTRAYISKDQLQWLKEKLADQYQKGKPIFMFLHQHLDNTNGWIGVDPAGAQELKDILARYPEVVLFTSHTHRQLDQTSVKLNQPFIMVHTGAIHYTFVPDPSNHGKTTREPLIQGLYVEVKGNNVVIKGRDLKERSWIFTQELNGMAKSK